MGVTVLVNHHSWSSLLVICKSKNLCEDKPTVMRMDFFFFILQVHLAQGTNTPSTYTKEDSFNNEHM